LSWAEKAALYVAAEDCFLSKKNSLVLFNFCQTKISSRPFKKKKAREAKARGKV
jgi:hypothetical protein